MISSLVAVHGLNGTARKTWTEPVSGSFWLEDFLPAAIPKARIMTFGYDSTLAFSRSNAGIESFARDLLNRLRFVRSSYEAANRPLVFICHSLGGIVALILAHEADIFYGTILSSTKGIIFMGTPHRGSDLVPWAVLLAKVVEGASIPVSRQVLYLNGSIVKNDEPCQRYFEQRLTLVFKSDPHPQQLSIGAGGNITQKIYRDTNDPRIWDIDSSRILNVQIVDAQTFKLVTGLDPPPTPITAETYKSMGLPFYQYDAGGPDKEAGIPGAGYGNIVGVAEAAEKNLPNKAHPKELSATTSGEDWGLSCSDEDDEGIDQEIDKKATVQGEQGFDFPVVLLSVDDSVPKFESIMDR